MYCASSGVFSSVALTVSPSAIGVGAPAGGIGVAVGASGASVAACRAAPPMLPAEGGRFASRRPPSRITASRATASVSEKYPWRGAGWAGVRPGLNDTVLSMVFSPRVFVDAVDAGDGPAARPSAASREGRAAACTRLQTRARAAGSSRRAAGGAASARASRRANSAVAASMPGGGGASGSRARRVRYRSRRSASFMPDLPVRQSAARSGRAAGR